MKYIIFGSGGLSKEVIDLVESDGNKVIGVVSTLNFDNKTYSDIYKVYSSYENILDTESKFLLAVADPELKRKLVSINPDRWETFIHSSAHVSKFAQIGKGTIVCPHAIINGDAIVGDFVTLNNYTHIAHDSIVGNYSTFSPYSGIMGHCSVGEDTFFGTAAYSIPNVKLGNKIKVSAGSMVRHSYSFECVLQGNPAKPRQ
jgi:sugar O-acyltransferase (sialic acid O-acetyltransferase NeuD family)